MTDANRLSAALATQNGIEVEGVRALFKLPCCGGSGFDMFAPLVERS